MAAHARVTDDGSPLALAETAFSRVEADASGAAELAGRALALARSRSAPDAEVAALHALAYARYELGDPRSLRTARAAVRAADRHGLARRGALARRRLALELAGRGHIEAAMRELDAACAALDEHELARSQVFRLGMHFRAGRPPQSLVESDRALEVLRRHDDAIWEARLRHNRGLLLADRGDITIAATDLARARDLFARLGAHGAAAGIEIELARVALARGDLPAGLAQLDAVDPSQLPAGYLADLELLRARALAAAGLADEALAALDEARAIWARSRVVDHEARLEVVRLTLLAGDAPAALRLARTTRAWFARRDSPLHAARADGLALAAAIAAGRVTRGQLARAREAAAALAGGGCREEALRVRVAVARGALELGCDDEARSELDACRALHRRGPVVDRIEAWHVEALLRHRAGDGPGALRAARAGLALLDGYRAALGASDLRAGASSIGVGLARLGLRIAVSGARGATVLAWSERLRASALRLDPVTPPERPELRERQRELRRVVAEIRAAEASGRGAQALVARQTALEASIRRLARHAPGGAATTSATPGPRALSAQLGERTLVELVELDGRLAALTLAGGRLVQHELGPVEPVVEQIEWLRFALSRLARLPATAVQRETLRAGARAAADELDRALLAPLGGGVADAALGSRGRELVIVPTGSLHALPWGLLGSLRGRPVTIAPSAATWLALNDAARPTRDGPRGRVALVAGPGLRHADAELRAVARCHPGATVLRGEAARVGEALEAIDGAAVVHLACHGRFRADSPLFSSLELADGPLNVYELQRLRHAPELVVLSACELALSDSRPGDELLGFAAALLELGTRTVLASGVAVPDAAALRLMCGLHARLAAGRSPAAALAEAQDHAARRDPSLGAFVCLGRG